MSCKFSCVRSSGYEPWFQTLEPIPKSLDLCAGGAVSSTGRAHGGCSVHGCHFAAAPVPHFWRLGGEPQGAHPEYREHRDDVSREMKWRGTMAQDVTMIPLSLFQNYCSCCQVLVANTLHPDPSLHSCLMHIIN